MIACRVCAKAASNAHGAFICRYAIPDIACKATVLSAIVINVAINCMLKRLHDGFPCPPKEKVDLFQLLTQEISLA